MLATALAVLESNSGHRYPGKAMICFIYKGLRHHPSAKRCSNRPLITWLHALYYDVVDYVSYTPVPPRNMELKGREPGVVLAAGFTRNAPPGRHCDHNGLYGFVQPNGSLEWPPSHFHTFFPYLFALVQRASPS